MDIQFAYDLKLTDKIDIGFRILLFVNAGASQILQEFQCIFLKQQKILRLLSPDPFLPFQSILLCINGFLIGIGQPSRLFEPVLEYIRDRSILKTLHAVKM